MLHSWSEKISVVALVVALSNAHSLFAAEDFPRVPKGFTIEKVASSPLVQFPMMGGFDDRGRLFLASSAGVNLQANELMQNPPSFIRMLEDTDGDGAFDKSTIFADKLTLPQGAVWYRGALYVASPPNIWRFEDTDDDGVADKREILVNSFLFSGNAASIHGCFLGPNGHIYWCDGRHGHELSTRTEKLPAREKRHAFSPANRTAAMCRSIAEAEWIIRWKSTSPKPVRCWAPLTYFLDDRGSIA